MIEFHLTGFEIKRFFGGWGVNVSGDININGIKTRVYDSFSFVEMKDYFTLNEPKDMTFYEAERLFSNYYKQKLSGRGNR
jgi:hypothetical protein